VTSIEVGILDFLHCAKWATKSAERTALVLGMELTSTLLASRRFDASVASNRRSSVECSLQCTVNGDQLFAKVTASITAPWRVENSSKGHSCPFIGHVTLL